MLYARAGDEGIGVGLTVDGEVVGIHDLGDLGQHAVLAGGRVLQLAVGQPDGVVFLHKEVDHVAEQLIGAFHLALGLAVGVLERLPGLRLGDAKLHSYGAAPPPRSDPRRAPDRRAPCQGTCRWAARWGWRSRKSRWADVDAVAVLLPHGGADATAC